jgi:predicted ribosomally synthesized peptide with SipW-like signal peptide
LLINKKNIDLEIFKCYYYYSKGGYKMEKGKNNTVMLAIIGIATLLIAVVGATFAYFSAVVNNSETSKTVSIKSASIVTDFTSRNVITATDIYPRAEVWGSKQFTISTYAATGYSADYTVNLVVDALDGGKSAFTAGQLVYTLEVDAANTTTDNGTTITPKTDATVTGAKLPVTGTLAIGNGTLAGAGTDVQVKHSYILKVYFPDTGVPQNNEQGKQFKAHLEVVGGTITTP